MSGAREAQSVFTPFAQHSSAGGARVRPFELDPVPAMTLVRTTARGLLLTTCALLLAAGAAAASAEAAVPQLVFPVLGEVSYIDDFGDPRVQGSHEGNDIMAPRWAPVVAAEAGKVTFWTTSPRAGCMLYLYGKSGTTYMYIHLNDRPRGNGTSGGCVSGVAYAPGLKSGATVAAGQLIGFNGNSGDAARTGTHTQFEVHPGGGGPVNPYPYLRRARRLLFTAPVGSTFTLALKGRVAGAAGQDLQVAVDQVRRWPGGLKVKQAGQKVGVTVPETATIEGAPTAALPEFPSLDLLTRGLSVTVFTEPATVTFAALSGAKGTLAASRIVVASTP